MPKRLGALSKNKFRNTQNGSTLKVLVLYFWETKVQSNTHILICLQINENGVRKFTYFCFSFLRLVRFLVDLEASIEAAR